MIKVIPPDSWDFEEEPLALVRLPSYTRFYGSDRAALIKRSGHGELAEWVKHAAKLPGEVWAHAIAMGADESAGNNRNADTWFETDLIKDAHTFETIARLFRNHENRNPSKSYGVVKKAWYNPSMRRVELILAYNGTKEAAERTGGLVAEKEVQDLEKGASYPGSMSVCISHDVCLTCNNHAKHKSEYCTERTCAGGGMKKHAGRTLEDGRRVVVSNHNNTFFDYSRVFRPADRTAYVLGKVACAPDVKSGAELACELGLSTPLWLLEGDVSTRPVLSLIKAARELASREQDPTLPFSAGPCVLDLSGLEPVDDADRAMALKALALEKVALSLPEWLMLTSGVSEKQARETAVAVATAWTHVRPLADLGDDPDLLRSQAFPTQTPSSGLMCWARKQARDLALTPDNLCRRVWRSVIAESTCVVEKQASSMMDESAPAAVHLARLYGAYLASVVATQKSSEQPLTAELALRQNRWSTSS